MASKAPLYRTNMADLELRGADGRTVVGIAMPFDQPAEIAEAGHRYTETFRRGAFSRSISERGDRVKFMALHDHRRFPLGRATVLREDPAGLYIEARVSATRDGDEALELIRDGALDGLSVGFRAIRDQWNRTRTSVERLEVALHEVSAVPFAAYSGARIAAVRTDTTHLYPVELAVARLRLLDL